MIGYITLASSEKYRRASKIALAGMLLTGMGLLVGCQTAAQKVENHEDNLAAAGFIIRPANTPERKAMLSRLPPHRFIRRENGDTVHFVYADPLVCGCLYVGSQQAYNQYKRDQQQKSLADEQQMAADAYSDAQWDWGAWGPWGPAYGPGYSFGYRVGYGW